MKADLRKYKGYTILYNAFRKDSGMFCPVVTLFKSGEKTIKLNFMRTFSEKDRALSFAFDAGNVAVDAKIRNHKLDFANHRNCHDASLTK